MQLWKRQLLVAILWQLGYLETVHASFAFTATTTTTTTRPWQVGSRSTSYYSLSVAKILNDDDAGPSRRNALANEQPRRLIPPRSNKLFMSHHADEGETNAPVENTADWLMAQDKVDDDDDEIQKLYKIVAEHDPEWFEEYVINILGKDAVAGMDWTSRAVVAPPLSPVASSTDERNAAAPTKRQAPLLTHDDNDNEENNNNNNVVELASSSSQRLNDALEQLQSANNSDSTNLDDTKSNERKFNQPTERVPEVVVVVVEESIDSPAQHSSKNDILPDDPVASDSANTTDARYQISDPTNKVVNGSATTTKLRDVTFSRNDSVTERNRSTDVVSTSAPVSEATTTVVERTHESEEIMVLFKEPLARSWSRVPLIRFLQLGYLEADVQALDPRALDSIATGGIRKPRSGIPSRWKISKNDELSVVLLVKKGESPEDEIESSRRQAKMNSSTTTTTITTENRPEPQADQNYGDEPSSLPSSTGQRYIGKSNTTPEEEFELSSDRKGMTQKKRDEANSKAASFSRPPENDERTGRSKEGSKINSGPLPDIDDSQIRESSRAEPEALSRDNKKAKSTFASTDSQRPPTQPRRYGENSNRKIYNGRSAVRSETNQSRRRQANNDDPPQPKSGFWPDIDSFRDMLRNEAGLRLRILGDDWSDAVKDESEWRLNLYKDWLWTLHDGVGDPLVESPSERMRRKERARRRVASDKSRRRPPPPRSRLETKKRRESSKD